jgi:hypothetical protein
MIYTEQTNTQNEKSAQAVSQNYYKYRRLVFILAGSLRIVEQHLCALRTAVPSVVHRFGGELPLQLLQLADHVWLGLSLG